MEKKSPSQKTTLKSPSAPTLPKTQKDLTVIVNSNMPEGKEGLSYDIVELALLKHKKSEEVANEICFKFKEHFGGEWTCFVGVDGSSSHYAFPLTDANYMHVRRNKTTVVVARTGYEL